MTRWDSSPSDLTRQTLIALLVASLVAVPPRASAEVKDTPDGKQWKVKCEHRSDGICPGPRLRLTVGPQKIIVTVRGMTESQDKFAYHTVEHGSAEGWNNFWNGFDPSSSGDIGDALGAVVLVLVLAGFSAILEQVKQTDHQAVLFWRGEEGEKTLVVSAREDECKSLLTELHRVTGLDWRDLPEETREVAQQFQQDQDKVKMTRVDLDRSATVPGRSLRLLPGRYQLVLLEREPNLGELYFYSGPDTKLEHFVGRSVVKLEDRAPDAATAPVTYTEEGGRVTISEVQFEEKVLKLVATPPGPTTAVGAPVAPSATRPDPAEILRSCRTFAVSSKTVWFKPGLLQEALQKNEEFKDSGLGLTADEKQADVVIQVNRPLFTFDWTYVIAHRESGAKLGEGKIAAWDDKSVAPELAREVLARFKSLRPAAPPQPQPQPQPPPQPHSQPQAQAEGEPWAVP